MTKSLAKTIHAIRPLIAATALFLSAVMVHAADLHSAKAQGLVGETPGGYLALVRPDAPADVQAMVNQINNERRSHYSEIAQRNGTSLQSVEALAGQKAIEMTPAGQYVQDGSGQWLRK